MLRAALLSPLALLLVSCVLPAPAPVVVVVESAPPPLSVAAPPSDHGEQCSVLLAVKPIVMDSSTCFIDARVRDKVGELVFPCAGGAAEARFSGARFQGSVSRGMVDVSLSTSFDFEDGCRWVSQQHLSGPASGPELEYTYTEAPAPGQRGCASACAAQARVTVSRRRGSSGASGQE